MAIDATETIGVAGIVYDALRELDFGGTFRNRLDQLERFLHNARVGLGARRVFDDLLEEVLVLSDARRDLREVVGVGLAADLRLSAEAL